jgi:flagellar motor switch protein FliG
MNSKYEKNIEIISQIIKYLLNDEINSFFPNLEKKGPKEFSNIQKAALFTISVGVVIAENIYRYLEMDEIETLTYEITRIDKILPSTKTQILEEFDYYITNWNLVSTGGIDYAKVILEKSLGTPKAIDVINRLTSSLQLRPFDFIRRTDPVLLLNFIQQEHPQTIAVILSFLEPNKSSLLLQNLPEEISAEVLKRIICLGHIEPETLREVERVLEKKLSTLSSEDYLQAGGINSAVEILNLVDDAMEKQLIESLEDEIPELAEEVKKRMFVFEDIIILDDRAIQKVMREVDSVELAKSLKGVDVEVQNKIFSNMSKRAADMLREDMEYMGPVRLKDVEESQQKIVSIIRHLEDQGEIIISRDNDFVGENIPEKEINFNEIISSNNNLKLIIDNISYITILSSISISSSKIKNKILSELISRNPINTNRFIKNIFYRLKFLRIRKNIVFEKIIESREEIKTFYKINKDLVE